MEKEEKEGTPTVNMKTDKNEKKENGHNKDTSAVLVGKEAKMISVISTFLNVHPFGAGTEYIWSYLLRLDPGIQYRDVETLLEKYPSCFTMEVEGVGASLSRKW